MMAEVVYKLQYPIAATYGSGAEARDETIFEISLRRPIAKDLLITDGVQGEVAKTLAVIAQLSGLPRVLVEKMDAADLTAVGAIIEGFMPPGLPTGATS